MTATDPIRDHGDYIRLIADPQLPANAREGIEQRFKAVREARPPAAFSDALGELEHYLDALVDADVIPFDLRVAIIEPIGDAWSVALDQLQGKLHLPPLAPAGADDNPEADVEELMIDILKAVGPVSEREAMAQLLGRLAKRLLEGNPSARAQLQGVLQGIWFTGMLSDRDQEKLSQRVIELAERISATRI